MARPGKRQEEMGGRKEIIEKQEEQIPICENGKEKGSVAELTVRQYQDVSCK